MRKNSSQLNSAVSVLIDTPKTCLFNSITLHSTNFFLLQVWCWKSGRKPVKMLDWYGLKNAKQFRFHRFSCHLVIPICFIPSIHPFLRRVAGVVPSLQRTVGSGQQNVPAPSRDRHVASRLAEQFQFRLRKADARVWRPPCLCGYRRTANSGVFLSRHNASPLCCT